MTRDALQDFLTDAFPQVADDFTVEEAGTDGVVLRLDPVERHLRPGGTVSGPAIFALADVAVYLAILSRIGPAALAVTTNCSIDFMRKPPPATPLRARAEILKLGRVLAVGEVRMTADGVAGPVARASLTYSIPPERPDG